MKVEQLLISFLENLQKETNFNVQHLGDGLFDLYNSQAFIMFDACDDLSIKIHDAYGGESSSRPTYINLSDPKSLEIAKEAILSIIKRYEY